MLARDVMTADPIAMAPDATVAEAARLMADKDVSGLPVVDSSGQLVGIITEGDLLRRKELGSETRRTWWASLFHNDKSLAGEFAKARGRFVREVMTRNIVCVSDDTAVGRVAELLSTLNVKRLPVLKNGALVGIVSRRDVMRSLAKLSAAEERLQKVSDYNVARGVLSRIENAPFVAAIQVHLTVTDGVVEIFGTASSENQRQAVRAMIEETPGVSGVIDRMTVSSSSVPDC